FAKALGINTSLVHYYLMLLLSFTVVASLQTVGVILVVAMLITPASTAILWSDRLKKILLISSFFGALSAISGLVFAILLEIPPGPSMAVAAFIFYLLSALFAPQKGVMAAHFKKRKYRRQVIEEDLLKYLFKHSQKKEISAVVLSEKLGIPTKKVEHYLSQMKNRGLLKLKTKGYWKCTEKGMEKGAELVRAHRLWETWLVANTGLKEDQIHEDAELYEHILDNDIIDHIDAALGFPDKDPHGEYIPQIYSRKTIEIKELEKGDRFILTGEEEWQSSLEQKSGISLINRVLIVSSHEGDKIVFQRRNLPEKYEVPLNPGFTVLHLSPKKVEIPEQV
nr:metal ABC transporter permease [Saprospiraceae bacterium]